MRVNRHQSGTSEPLVEHVRIGRRYLPQLAATGVLHLGDWVRDDLPDLLWPVLLLGHRDTTAARSFVRWQAAVLDDLRGVVEAAALAEARDGRLTGLDRLIEQHPGAKTIVKQRAAEFDLLPDPVADALATYPDRPAAWLVERDLRAPTSQDIELLVKSILEAIGDGHREAVIKCLHIWSAVQAGTFRSDVEMIELLKPYPNDTATRDSVDSVVRSSWGATKGMLLRKDAGRFDDSIRWAKVFWGVNSLTTRCIRRRDAEQVPHGGSAASTEEDALEDGAAPSGGEHLEQLAMDLVSSYVQALETAPARLYDQERQEVHAGLVCRAGRDVITALGYPDLWCIEHGSHIVRALVEVKIYLEWMATQDPTIYQRFREYGSGKAKLYALIMNEIAIDARISGFSEAIEELDRLSDNDGHIDYRIVDTSDSFSGKSIRTMAEECGLLDLYRHAYYIASGVAHSEWWSVETNAMERCLNILHRGHLIPSLSLSVGRNVPLAQSWVDHLYALIRRSLSILGTDRSAVTDAFAWLEGDESETDLDDRAT